MILFGLPRGIKIIDSEDIDDINIPFLTGFYSAISRHAYESHLHYLKSLT
jgi:hypothetical protein